MEEDTPKPEAQYSSTEALVSLVDITDGLTTTSQLRKQRKTETRRRTALWILKLLGVFTFIIMGPVVTFLVLRQGEKVSVQGEESAHVGLPEVLNLRLVSAADDYFTASWERPEGPFDHFLIDVTGESGDGRDANETHHVGSCASGTILHLDETRVTCTHLEACTKVNLTVRTYKNGPPRIASAGVTLQDVLIPGQDPEPPKKITAHRTSPSRTRLQWEPTEKASGGFALTSYAVKICDMVASCEAYPYFSGCRDHETTATSLEFESTSNSSYCVVVTTVHFCGGRVTASSPAVQELKATFSGLPEVENIRLVSAPGDSFTVTWDRPEGDFDHYWIDVAADSGDSNTDNETHSVGSCVRGTILHVNQTRVTCTHLEACTTVNFTVRTYKNGPPQIASSGVTLQGILIPGQDPQPPEKITIEKISPSRTRLQWEPPAKATGGLTSYAVKVCDMFAACDARQYISGCKSHETMDASLEFDSVNNSSYCIMVTTVNLCGGRVTASSATVKELKAPLSAPPDVTNLRLEAIGDDSFTASWQRPRGTFDYYWVDVTDNRQNLNGTGPHKLGSCANGTILHPDQTNVTCNRLEACANVTFRVRTHWNASPVQTSPGVSLRGIFIPGGAPDDFDVDATATSLTTVQITLHLSKVKKCLKAKCYGRLLGGSKPVSFPCQDFVGSNKTLTAKHIEPRRTYILHVILTNSHNDKNATKAVVFRIP